MVFGVDDAMMIAAGAQLLGGLMGSDEGEQREAERTGFAALPPEVQDAYLKQFLPAAQRQFQTGPTPPPMGRAQTGKFSSKALQELQQYADTINKQRNSPEGKAQAAQQAQMQAQQQAAQNAQQNGGSDQARINQLMYDISKGGRDKGAFGPVRNMNEELQGLLNKQRTNVDNPQQPQMQDNNGGFGLGQNMVQGFGGQPQGNMQAPQGQMQNQQMQMGSQLENGGMQGQGFDPSMGGIRPVGQIEPFNQLQENAFNQIENFQPRSIADYINPYAQQGLYQLSGLARDNPNERSIESYMNPWTDQVTNRTLSRLSQESQGKENALLGSQPLGHLGAFGGSALGTMLANQRNEAIQRAQDFIAQQNQANYGQAQNQRNLEIERQRGNIGNLIGMGNETFKIGGGLQDVGYGQQMQTLQNLLSAGNQVQGQGQNEANAANPLVQQQLPQNRLNQFGQHLAMFPNSGQSFSYGADQPNMLTRIGNAGMQGIGGYEAYQNYQNANNLGKNIGNSMPWLNQGGSSIGGLMGNAGGQGRIVPTAQRNSIGTLGGRV